jgi:hypothetical protein
MRLLRSFLRLSGEDKRILIQVTLLLAAIRTGLSLLPYRVVQRLVVQLSTRGRLRNADVHYRRRVLRAVRAAGRHLLGQKPCLTQALAVQWLFNRIGYPTNLRIGVAKDHTGKLLAHAWVEHEGKIIMGGPASSSIYERLRPVKESADKEAASAPMANA